MADFESHAQGFHDAGIRLLAASTDPEDEATKSRRELKVTYPLAFGLDVEEIAEKTGAYFEPKKKFLHATGFILKPDGTVAHAVYSTGPIGRYTASDALDLTSKLSKA